MPPTTGPPTFAVDTSKITSTRDAVLVLRMLIDMLAPRLTAKHIRGIEHLVKPTT